MANSILIKKINDAVERIGSKNNQIVVLKGIPMDVVDSDCQPAPLEEIVKDKLKYFMAIYNNRKYITYEEFLLLNSFVLTQYESICVLNNNLYMSQYPLDAKMTEETRNGLLVHFTESENDYDETPIGDIDEIIDLYDGVKDYRGILIGAYCEDKVPDDNKIIYENLFEHVVTNVPSVSEAPEEGFLEIEDESDYIELIRRLFTEPDDIFIRTINYTGDIDRLDDHIAVLCKYWSDVTDIYTLQPQEVQGIYEHREEYTNILKKYWGADKSFRQFEIYNLKKLEEGKKETQKVSQEQIIADLVQQSENCEREDETYRDVFVTAPTGAGKSIIFQVPAIYLAEKYNLLTIVVSPLIGLMNDQVNNLERRNYKGAKTINSDISPIVKEEILTKVQEGEYHILYLSPETLLARSDVEQLIGDRTIGMIIIDEAHIVTTWGKQFRPDYWYLGEHIRKLRTRQIKKKGRSFVIGTFTATAIYHGVEDMYEETKNSLHMIDPITYLGYVKRGDITIRIDTSKKAGRTEYDTDKFDQIIDSIKRASITNKKTLIYFPTVSLIEQCYQYLEHKKMVSNVTKYYGPLKKDVKDENYQMFLNGEKTVMFATKAFGMGIDIDDIQLVIHFAPTGNVCDYVQEIGRAARRPSLEGEAFYHYNTRDFKYINRLHGLSTIKKYQLIEVVKKIDELYSMNRGRNNGITTKKKNAMLVDAENFTYIFDNPMSEGDDNINKVKTALLIIQKDFEAKIGFSPITVRPIPLFSMGFFAIEPATQKMLAKRYDKDCLEEIDKGKHICRVNLEKIWDKDYKNKSFPQFKYLLYSHDEELEFNSKYTLRPALCVKVQFIDDFTSKFNKIWKAVKNIANQGTVTQEFVSESEFYSAIHDKCGIRKYKAMTMVEVLFASMDIYRRNYMQGTNSIYQRRELQSGEVKYQFKTAINSYFSWVERGFERIQEECNDGNLYIINSGEKHAKEYSTILGIMEALDVLTFEMTGGANSQLYIYVNQVRNIKNIVNNPGAYKNRLLEMVSERHLISVKMLTYIYEGNFDNAQIWDILEDYFLGIIPNRVKAECKKEDPNIEFEI